MIPRGIAKRYAAALFGAALKAAIADQVQEEMQGLASVLSARPDFRAFILSPQVPTAPKRDLVRTTFGGRTSDLFVRFLLLLIDKGRFIYLEEIIEAYRRFYEDHQGIVEVKVITAIPLDDAMERKFIAKLERETRKRIRLVPSTDPSIVGGAILLMDDRIIDGSVRHRLEKLRRALDEVSI